MKQKKIKKACLVYQGGLANVFAVDCFHVYTYGRNAIRLLQNDFNSCAMFARGLKAAGITVMVLGCNQAGDISQAIWTDCLESLPFSEKFTNFASNNELL